MKTGISTASLFLRQELEQAFETIKGMGADCVEVFYNTFYEYRPEFSQKLDASGIEVGSVHINTHQIEHSLFSPSRRVRGDAFYWIDQVMRSAQILGCKAYTFHGKVGKVENLDEIVDPLSSAVEFCARYGVKLCLETVAWSIYHRPKVFSYLKERIPSLCGVFDIKQARRSGYKYTEYIEDMKGAISHVHLSDVDRDGKMCLPGKGTYNFKEILTRLKDAGFDGNILIEAYKDDYSDISELKTSLEYLNEIIYKIK